MATTSIQISQDLQKELNRMKLYDRETYEEVIWNIIEDTKELSEQTHAEIAQARKEMARGEFISFADVKKRYGTDDV